MAKKSSRTPKPEPLPRCFVIMPIGESVARPDHFRRVYVDLFKPACKEAGYDAFRGDEERSTDLIHLNILRNLLEAPMAICDLSERNPNVLFELGIRQAFDKPVVLVAEENTPKIFDIAGIRQLEYRSSRRYHEVLEDQTQIAEAIRATAASGENASSLVRLLSITKAQLPDAPKTDQMLQYLIQQVERLGPSNSTPADIDFIQCGELVLSIRELHVLRRRLSVEIGLEIAFDVLVQAITSAGKSARGYYGSLLLILDNTRFPRSVKQEEIKRQLNLPFDEALINDFFNRHSSPVPKPSFGSGNA